ncbi:MAG: PLP-dependent transferase [Candidatus Thiodiazotropha sp.]
MQSELAKILRLVSIGDARSLACHPVYTTHRQRNEEKQTTAEISADIVHLSNVTEHVDDIIADISRTLGMALVNLWQFALNTTEGVRSGNAEMGYSSCTPFRRRPESRGPSHQPSLWPGHGMRFSTLSLLVTSLIPLNTWTPAFAGMTNSLFGLF